jgi:hypothetical protein
MPSGDRWLPKIVLRNAACDPGFDFQNVCAGGPDRSILFRAATNPAVADPTAWLRELPDGAKTPRNTGVRLNVVGNQWLWLGKPIL